MAPRKTITLARNLRREMSLPEVKLWAELRARPKGLRFRRQHPLGPFVIDFYCPTAKLAIEVDGMAHELGDRPERDEARDRWLQEQGIFTLRISARDVLAELDAVLTMILNRCALPLHHPSDGPPPHASHREDV